jgi:gluconate 2-dehydrogenase gamma chain
MRRRNFIRVGVTAAVAGPTVSCSRNPSPWRFFTVEEARTLEVLCEQVIPADSDPGAAWAGVVQFIDRQLKGFHKPFQPVYRTGLAETDRTASERFGKRFVELDGAQQMEVMKTLETKSKPFFDALVSHTMQGFYGSPRHGGNRDAVSWRMLGVPVPPVRGRR